MRRGFLFSTDALLAGLLLIGGLILVLRISSHEPTDAAIATTGQDLLASLSSVKVSELSNPWVASLIEEGVIEDANVTVLEQIGYFWALEDIDTARNLSALLFANTSEGRGLRLSFDNETVYERIGTKAGDTRIASSRMVTGISAGEALTGSSASAYLRRIKDKRDFLFFPFGGFVGEGNITVLLDDLPSDANVTDIIIEAATSRPFILTINGGSCDMLVPNGSVLVPTLWNRTNCTSLLNPGSTNSVGIIFTGQLNGSYLSGGYVKIPYRTDEFSDAQPNTSVVYRFPRIDGLINLYDGFYIDGTAITGINVSLWFRSNYTSYLTIGNASWTFAANVNDQYVFLNTTQVQSALASAGMTLTQMEQATTPLKFGIGSITLTGSPSDTIIVTDTSGSMTWCTQQTESACFDNCNCGPCSSGGGTCGSQSCGIFSTCGAGDQKKIDAAKNATQLFISYLLNNTGPLVGLTEFGSSVKSDESLTTNTSKLLTEVGNYSATGGTCICCGVNRAVELLLESGQVTLVPRQSSGWKYNDQDLGSPPVGWTALGYSDATWKTGTMAIGWWYSGLSTTIGSSYRYDGDYFYRKKFNVTNATDIASLALYVRSDDGAEVYLNGVSIDDDYPSTHNALYWNRNGISVDPGLLVEGENILAVRQYHAVGWWSAMAFDVELVGSLDTSASARTQNIVIMTDGQASNTCSQQGTGSASQDAIQAACDAHDDYGIIVYTVGFGQDADASTLQQMADCAAGEYFLANDTAALQEAFSSIGSTIIQQSGTQRAIIDGDISRTILYGNSTIEVEYAPAVQPPQPNEIEISLQSDRLANCSTVVDLSGGSRFIEALVTSYSDDYWTDRLVVNGVTVYNLSEYAPLYADLGDPYRIRIPPALLVDGNNTISLGIATDATNASTICSLNNTVVYSIAINLSTERSDAVPLSEGCTWLVDVVGNVTLNLTIPSSYSGANSCSYRQGNISYDDDDAYQLGAYALFDRLDFDHTGSIAVNLNEQDLEIIVTTIGGVPYLWGPAVARIEVTP